MRKKLAFLGIFIALAMIFSYIESLIPFFFGIPGMKLGLANALIVILLYLYGPKEAIGVNLVRIFLTGILFGNAFSIVYSLAGGLLSFLVMVFLKKTRLKMVSVSVVGAIFHNLGQLIVAMVVLNSVYLGYYFTVLLISGFITGLVMGIISTEVTRRLKREG